MRFATAALVAFAFGAISAQADLVEKRACNGAKALSLIKKNHYTKFCSNLLRPTATATITSTIFTDNAGSTVTVTNHAQATVNATLLAVSNTFIATNTATVTNATTTLANPTFPVQQAARLDQYRVRPTKPASVVHCAYSVLQRECAKVVKKTPPKVTATVTELITTGIDAAPTTVVEQGDVQTNTNFVTSTQISTGTATATATIAATATAAAFLAFKDFGNDNLIRELEFDSDATTHKGKLVSTLTPATVFTFRATGGTAVAPATTPPNPAHDGIVTGLLTTGSGATQRCLSAGATNDINTVACDTTASSYDAFYTATAASQFTLNPRFLYVYSGAYPVELHRIIAGTAAGTYQYPANSATFTPGTFSTLYLTNSNATGF